LANVNDDVCTRIPGLFKLKQRAQNMVDKAEKSAPFIKMQAEYETLKDKLAAMENTIAEQTALIANMKKGK